MAQDGRTPSTGCVVRALGALLVLGALPFGIAAVTGDGGSSPSATTTTIADSASVTTEPPREPISEPTPVSGAQSSRYSVTYRVETFSGSSAVVDTEVRSFVAPYMAQVVSTEDEPGTGGSPQSRTTQVLGGFETTSDDQDPTVLTVAPGMPSRLAHFAGDLSEAVELGVVEFEGVRREILGERCEDYRTKAPLDVARLEAPTSADFTVLCIAPDGMVLREEWHSAGALFRRRTAVGIDRSEPGDRIELAGYKLPSASGGGRVRRLVPESTAPGVDHFLPEMSEDFRFDGRFVFVADQIDTGATQVDVERLVALVDVFLSDGDSVVLTVENGATTAALVAGRDVGTDVDIPGFEAAWSTVATYRNEVVVTAGRRFVRLAGNLPVGRLVELARTLRPRDGTGSVTPFDEAELDVTGRVAPEDAEG